ncbi:MAG: hypothetical protein K5873_10500 [Treponema sp.]|nr:hypothetical protein [Treponema sp.]
MKRVFISLLFLIFSFIPLFGVTDEEKDFIKASLKEKIEMIKNLSLANPYNLLKLSLDFTIENASMLSGDQDFTSLALISAEKLPSDGEKINVLNEASKEMLSERLMAIFKISKNPDLRKVIVEKIPLYAGSKKKLTVDFLNDYLLNSYKIGLPQEDVVEGAIVKIGEEGDETSLSIIFNIWSSNIWPDYQKSAGEALLLLSQDSFADVIKIFSLSNPVNSSHYFTLLKNSDKISKNSLCDVAENALLIAINNAERMKDSDEQSKKALSALQLQAQELLAQNKWSHASSVINSNVLLAKKSYEEGFMDEEAYASIISSSSKIPSQALAQTLTEILSECNGKVTADKSKMPARTVVLALIFALGELGDKTAFDTLLTVTYISYPLEVIDAAKASLAKLNW